MARRYEALTELLLGRTEAIVELPLSEIDTLVGRLPDPAHRYSAWWSNARSSHPHSRYWLDSGRLARPNVSAKYVRFVLEDHVEEAAPDEPTRPGAPILISLETELEPDAPPEESRILVTWMQAGPVRLDVGNEPVFPSFSSIPGLYRMHLVTAQDELLGVYLGEAVDLSERMSDYRSPASTDSVDQRVHDLIIEVLESGGSVRLSVILRASLDDQELDLAARSARLALGDLALIQLVRRGDPIANI